MLNDFFDKFIFVSAIKFRMNNFLFYNTPFLILPTEILISLIEKNDENLNREIYYSVKKAVSEKILKQFHIDFGNDRDSALNFSKDFFQASGWGEITIIDLDYSEKRAIVDVKNSAVATALSGKAKHPADHFLRGIFAGMFKEVFREDVDCVETECSVFAKPECQFIIKKREAFDSSSEKVKRQLYSV